MPLQWTVLLVLRPSLRPGRQGRSVSAQEGGSRRCLSDLNYYSLSPSRGSLRGREGRFPTFLQGPRPTCCLCSDATLPAKPPRLSLLPLIHFLPYLLFCIFCFTYYSHVSSTGSTSVLCTMSPVPRTCLTHRSLDICYMGGGGRDRDRGETPGFRPGSLGVAHLPPAHCGLSPPALPQVQRGE